MSANDLSGTVPASVGNWSKIERLFLDGNRFSGLLPNMSFSDMTYCYLDANSFACPFPAGAMDSCKKLSSTDALGQKTYVSLTDGDCGPTRRTWVAAHITLLAVLVLVVCLAIVAYRRQARAKQQRHLSGGELDANFLASASQTGHAVDRPVLMALPVKSEA